MKEYNTSQFIKDLGELNITLTDKQISQFLEYYELLIEENKVMNLTTITEYDEVMKKHFVDSAVLSKAVEIQDGISLIDVGTGAGFPGLALKIIYPEMNITLLDSLKKRVLFLDKVILKLQLNKIETIHGRAEDFARPNELREKYDIAVSRAVANLASLTEYCLPFVKKGGYFIAYKTNKIEDEVKNAKGAIHVLGGKLIEEIPFVLPDTDYGRSLIKIKKTNNTPIKYPRKAGLPTKEPIL